MGYDSQYHVMNAKDYGVAQNRERCFMVSWLGDYSYTFPDPIPLKKRLKDYLEDAVADNFYLTDEQISTFVAKTEEHKKNGNGFAFHPIDIEEDKDPCSKSILSRQREWLDGTYLAEKKSNRVEIIGTTESQNGNRGFKNVVYGESGVSPTILARDYKDPVRVGQNTDAKPKRLFNIYGDNYGTGFAGNVWDDNGISPNLMTMQGGNREPMIIEGDTK